MIRVERSIRVPLCFLFSFLISSSVHAQDDPLRGLDAYIRRGMADWQVPGLAIAIVKDDSVVFLKGYGVREVGKDAPVDEQTIFALSSNTKAFTAAAVGLLVDEGKVSWDDPVIKHLPWFQLPDPWVTREVTLRDLLSHRVADDIGSWAGVLWAYTSFGRDEVLRRLRYLEPGKRRFRSRFVYCNECYLTAGEVVAVVSGMSYEDFVTSRILHPLGMTSATTTVHDLWDAAHLAPCLWCELHDRPVGFENARIENIVMPHVPGEGGPRPIAWRVVDNSAPAGSINASVEDAAKWVRFQLGKGVYEGERLVSAAVVDEMHKGHIIRPPAGWSRGGPGFGDFWAAGFGWFLTEYRGRKTVMHGGGIIGFGSFIAMMPEEHLGVVVLTNSRANLLPWALPFRVFDAYLGAPERDWSGELLSNQDAWLERREAQEQEIAAARVQGTTPSLPPGSYVGTYTHRAFGELTVTEERGTLVLRFPGARAGGLEHWHHDVYRVNWRDPPHSLDFLTFALDPAGRVEELRIWDFMFERVRESSQAAGSPR